MLATAGVSAVAAITAFTSTAVPVDEKMLPMSALFTLVVEADRDRLADVRADLEGRVAERTVQHLAAVERGLRGDTVDFRQALLHFLVQRGAVAVAVGRVGRLHGQFADALQVVSHFLQGAFRGLGQRDAVVGIAHGLGQTVDLGGHAARDGEAGGVVLRAVDAQARGQALQRGGQLTTGCRQIALGIQRHHVGVDDKCHEIAPNKLYVSILFRLSRPAGCAGEYPPVLCSRSLTAVPGGA